ncbi:MAG: PAS domain S-box protein [Syntrophomonadaceae bacterium]|nr:PAS domain S-box protein [Syntrophomonadaceae bacterium]
MMIGPSNGSAGQHLSHSIVVMQKALSQSEQPVFMGLPNGKIIYANQAFIDMLGYPAELINELSWDNDITLLSSNHDEEASIKKLIQTGEDQQYKKYLVTKYGVVFEVQVDAYSLMEPDYEPTIIAFFINNTVKASDIPADVPTDEEIAEIQPIDYQYLLDNINQIFYTYGLDGRITYANKKSIDILGFNPEEAIGIPLWEFVPQRYRESFITELNRRLDTSKPGTYLSTVIHRDGSERVFNLKVSPIIKQEKVMGGMTLAEDVTESRRINKELRESNKKLNRLSQELIAANQQLLATEEELRFQLDESEKNKDALANAHQRLETLFDFLPDPTYVINPEGQVVMWNRAMESLTGIRVRDIVGKGNYEYAIPFFGCRKPMLIDQARPGDQNNEYIKVNQKGQNTCFAEFYSTQLGKKGTYLAGKSSSLYNQRGELIGYIETLRDVSARKEAENALFESEKRYRTIIERIEDGYFEVDLSGNFVFCNRFLNEKLGYQAEEFLKLGFRDVMDERNQQIVKAAFNRVFLTGKPVRDFEWLVKGRSGREMYVESTVLPIYSEGEIAGFRGLVRDISDRKKAEEALQRSERNLSQQVNYLNTLIHNLNEMFFTYDLEGKIAFVNKRSYDVVGYYPEEMLGIHITELVPAEFRNKVRSGIAERLEQGLNGSYNLPVIHKNGSERIIKLNTSPIRDTQNRIIGGMVLAEDVTERNRAERALAISEAQYRAIVEDQTELIYRSLADNTLTFVNAAYCRYFEMSREDILEKDIYPEVYREDQNMVSSSLRGLSADNPVCTLEYRIVMPDGSLRWHQWTHRAIYNQTGEIVDYQSVGRDINKSKLAEEKLTFLSQHDVLTGLYNRLYFVQAMQ